MDVVRCGDPCIWANSSKFLGGSWLVNVLLCCCLKQNPLDDDAELGVLLPWIFKEFAKWTPATDGQTTAWSYHIGLKVPCQISKQLSH